MSLSAPTLAAEGATFPCPTCRRDHPWAAEYAGRTARCGCGHILKVPAALTSPEAAHQTPPAVPAADASDKVPSFLRMPAAPAGGDDALPADVEAELAAVAKYGEEDPNKPDPRRDKHVPLALIAIGFLITVADFAYAMHSHPGAALAAGVLVTGFKLVFGMILMLGAALVAARFAGVNFGPLGPALLKLAGLCLAPSALGDLTTSLLGGDMAVAQIGRIVQIVLTWCLVSYLFRLDGIHTMIVVGTITVVKIVAVVFIGSLTLLAFGSLTDGASGGGAADDEPAMTSLEEDLKILEESAPDDDGDEE